jgi:D-alanyl-D-alanine carboxypeptidase/D-alanyl-D-alanine-endopeptidase (penicillin-binding protein 4)
MLRRNFIVIGLLLAGIAAPRLGILARAGEQPRPRQERAGPPAALRQSVARFRARLEAKLAESGPSKGDWGVLVLDADTSRTLYALSADRYFTPASNTKLFTTALAMATLGPDYRFRTTLETLGRVDANGRLRGELVLVGRGDPNLSNRKFPYGEKPGTEGPPEKVLAELADAVVAQGIRRIEGDIVADDTYFVSDRYPRGWTIDDMTYGYAAPVSAICVNDNTLAVEVRPGEREGHLARFSVEPWADFYQF